MSPTVSSPRPDPESGEPRPPRAPSVAGAWAGHGENGRRSRSWSPAHPDDRLGPTLELAEASRRRAWRSVMPYSAGIAVVLAIVLALVLSGSPDLRADPVPYLIAVLVWAVSTTLALLVRRTYTVYAGADWAADGTDLDTVVTTYDLARIRVFGGAGPGAMLQLVAPDGDFLQLPLGLVEGNPALWDLIHNGLRHSTAAGAEVDPETRTLLHLP